MDSVVFLCSGALCAFTDLKYDRIFNGVVLATLMTLLTMRFIEEGAAGSLKALAICLSCTLILFPVYRIKGLGAGDVKLISALAPFLCTVRESIMFVMMSFVIGAAIGIGLMLVRRRIRGKMHSPFPYS